MGDPVTFLAPLAGIVAGALAVPVLLALYLLKLRRRPVRVSSTLLWQQAVEDLQVNVPLRWLKPSMLFFVQLLGILSLVAAIGRPALNLDRAASSTIIILIDTSASMSARDGGGSDAGQATRLDEAKRQASQLADGLAEQTGRGWSIFERLLTGQAPRAMVASFAGDARIVQPLTGNAGVLREAIAAIEGTDQPGDLAAALALLEAFAPSRADERGAIDKPTVFVFSDGGFGAAAGRVSGGLDVRFVRSGTAPDADGGSAGLRNLGIVALNARRDYEDPATVRLFARVQNASGTAAGATLRMTVDGADADLVSLNVPGAARGADGRVVPGERAVTLKLVNTTGGVVTLALSGAEGDLLSADDVASVVLAAPTPPGVLVVTPAGETEIDPFLKASLGDVPVTRVDPTGYAERTAASGGGAFAGVELVIFDRVTPSVLPPRASLSFGAGLPIAGLRLEESDWAGTRVVSWRRAHPLVRDVPLDGLVVDRPLRMTLPAEGGAVRTTVLAEGADGPLMAVLEGDGPTRVVMALDLVRSNWGRDFSFPVFMTTALEFLTLRGESQVGRWHTTTQPVRLRPEPGATAVSLSGPMERVVPITVTGATGATGPIGRGGSPEVEMPALELAGLYTAMGTRERAVGVNLADAVESSLATADRLDLVGVPGGVAAEARVGVGAPREIWAWLVMAALVLLTLEWVLYAARMRG